MRGNDEIIRARDTLGCIIEYLDINGMKCANKHYKRNCVYLLGFQSIKNVITMSHPTSSATLFNRLRNFNETNMHAFELRTNKCRRNAKQKPVRLKREKYRRIILRYMRAIKKQKGFYYTILYARLKKFSLCHPSQAFFENFTNILCSFVNF